MSIAYFPWWPRLTNRSSRSACNQPENSQDRRTPGNGHAERKDPPSQTYVQRMPSNWVYHTPLFLLFSDVQKAWSVNSFAACAKKTRTVCIFLAWQVEVLHLWLFTADDSQSTGAMAYLQAIFRPSNPSFVNWIHHRRGKAMVSLLKNDLDSWWVKPHLNKMQEANYQSQYITSSIVIGLMAFAA